MEDERLIGGYASLNLMQGPLSAAFGNGRGVYCTDRRIISTDRKCEGFKPGISPVYYTTGTFSDPLAVNMVKEQLSIADIEKYMYFQLQKSDIGKIQISMPKSAVRMALGSVYNFVGDTDLIIRNSKNEEVLKLRIFGPALVQLLYNLLKVFYPETEIVYY